MLPLKGIFSQGVLLHLDSGIHNRLFKLARVDNNRFHVMVCRGIVGTSLPKQFLVGTPRTPFPRIHPRQFPSTNPSPAHPATSHATSQALFPTTLAHQNFQALFPSGGRLHFFKRCFFFWPMQLPPFYVFRRHMSSEFGRRSMNKEDALRRLPSVCTIAITIATDFMQAMHVHKWTSVGTCDLTCRLSCQRRRLLLKGSTARSLGFPWAPTVPHPGPT